MKKGLLAGLMIQGFFFGAWFLLTAAGLSDAPEVELQAEEVGYWFGPSASIFIGLIVTYLFARSSPTPWRVAFVALVVVVVLDFCAFLLSGTTYQPMLLYTAVTQAAGGVLGGLSAARHRKSTEVAG